MPVCIASFDPHPDRDALVRSYLNEFALSFENHGVVGHAAIGFSHDPDNDDFLVNHNDFNLTIRARAGARARFDLGFDSRSCIRTLAAAC